jgi:nitrogen fixation NifU-like protein
MDLYREKILDHYKNPRNFGELADATVVAREANASCGDLIEFRLKVDGSIIKDVRFKGTGCALSIAASSMISEEVKGKAVKEVFEIDEEFMRDLLGIDVSSMRTKCIMLPLRAVKQALSQIEG